MKQPLQSKPSLLHWKISLKNKVFSYLSLLWSSITMFYVLLSCFKVFSLVYANLKSTPDILQIYVGLHQHYEYF
jgi:hypothetical protein